ncbi:unnamed protein product, partial [Oppiella nova]
MEDRITDEIRILIKHVDEANGRPFNIHKCLTPSISNNICHLVFGHRFDYDDPKRVAFDLMLETISKKSIITTAFLSAAPLWLTKRMYSTGAINSRKVFETVAGVIRSEISSHKKSMNPNNKFRDYIDGYLAEMEVRQRKDPNTHFTPQKLSEMVRILFGAGSSAVQDSIEFLLLLSVRYSEHQKRIHSEIDSVVGRDRSPCYADRLHMPFTQAFI